MPLFNKKNKFSLNFFSLNETRIWNMKAKFLFLLLLFLKKVFLIFSIEKLFQYAFITLGLKLTPDIKWNSYIQWRRLKNYWFLVLLQSVSDSFGYALYLQEYFYILYIWIKFQFVHTPKYLAAFILPFCEI